MTTMYALHWDALFHADCLAILRHGLALTCLLALLSSALSLLAGTLLAVGRSSGHLLVRMPCSLFCHAVRSIPGVFWLILIFFCLPMLLSQRAAFALNDWDGFPFWSAVAGLAIGGSPYFSDILFSFLSQESDALSAARLSGLSGTAFWLFAALPPAFLFGFPALSARLLHQLKNTSLAMVISVPELTWASQEVESLTFAGLEATSMATLLYLVLGGTASALLAAAERALRRRFPMGEDHA